MNKTICILASGDGLQPVTYGMLLQNVDLRQMSLDYYGRASDYPLASELGENRRYDTLSQLMHFLCTNRGNDTGLLNEYTYDIQFITPDAGRSVNGQRVICHDYILYRL